MKSLQLLAAMSVLALSISACSTTNTGTGGMLPTLSGQENPNTGKYTPPPSPMPPPPKTSSVGYPSSTSASV
jgi:hypothetical protein